MPYLPKSASLGERLLIAALSLPLAVIGSLSVLWIVGTSQA